MHLLAIAIHEIVDTRGEPDHARGSAAYSNGAVMEFRANLQYPHEYAIYIVQPPQPGAFYPHSDFVAADIYRELGLQQVYDAEHAALEFHTREPDHNSFTRKRIAACRNFMTDEHRKHVAHYRNQLPDSPIT